MPDEQIVILDGVTTTAKVAHVRLCHSRIRFVRAYPRESQEMVFDAHDDAQDRAFAFFGGAVLTDGLEAVEAACAEALEQGVYSAGVVLNILARHREPPPPLTITTPDALKRACEPAAHCDRSDRLRRTTDGTITGVGRVTPKACP